eukprot:g1249.t1
MSSILSDALSHLRKLGLDYYVVPSADAHGSEYTRIQDQRRAWLSGFKGSAGTLVLQTNRFKWKKAKDNGHEVEEGKQQLLHSEQLSSKTKIISEPKIGEEDDGDDTDIVHGYLWTDGRYYLQALKELYPGIHLKKYGMPGVPSWQTWLSTRESNANVVQRNSTERTTIVIGLDMHYISQSEFFTLEKMCTGNQTDETTTTIVLKHVPSVADSIGYVDALKRKGLIPRFRPLVKYAKYAGKSCMEKVAELGERMSEVCADYLLLTALDDISWLLNVRAFDVPYNPVILAYILLERRQTTTNSSKIILHIFTSDRYHNDMNDALLNDYGEGFELHSYDENKIIEIITRRRRVITTANSDTNNESAPPTTTVSVWMQPNRTNAFLYQNVKNAFITAAAVGNQIKVVNQTTPVEKMKALKNDIEIKYMQTVHLNDAVALCEYFFWLKRYCFGRRGENIHEEEAIHSKPDETMEATKVTMETKTVEMKEERIPETKTVPTMDAILSPFKFSLPKATTLNETSAADVLEKLRSRRPGFMGLSFPTISSSGPNGAIIHYSPPRSGSRPLSSTEVYLCDSGAHYLGGTTDVTRTVHFTEPTKFQKRCYTRVLQGHIALGSAIFPEGTSGHRLDTLARLGLWRDGLDYNHGTGHGVGAFLNVHEGPHGIGIRPRPNYSEGLLPRMTCTNEPGFYQDGQFGMRIENDEIIVQAQTSHSFNEKTYLTFESLTWVPLFAHNLIDNELLSPNEIEWINTYHHECWTRLSKCIDETPKDVLGIRLERLEELQRFIKFECRPISSHNHQHKVNHTTLINSNNSDEDVLSQTKRQRLK